MGERVLIAPTLCYSSVAKNPGPELFLPGALGMATIRTCPRQQPNTRHSRLTAIPEQQRTLESIPREPRFWRRPKLSLLSAVYVYTLWSRVSPRSGVPHARRGFKRPVVKPLMDKLRLIHFNCERPHDAWKRWEIQTWPLGKAPRDFRFMGSWC